MSGGELGENLRKFIKIGRVKELKKEQAFREVEHKKQEVKKAAEDVNKKTDAVEKSKAALPERIDQIYKNVMQKILSPDALEEKVKGEIAKVQKAHQNLEDQKERANHIFTRLKDELEKVRAHYNKTVRDVDKYGILTGEMEKEKHKIDAVREETEIEDSFRLKKARVL